MRIRALMGIVCGFLVVALLGSGAVAASMPSAAQESTPYSVETCPQPAGTSATPTPKPMMATPAAGDTDEEAQASPEAEAQAEEGEASPAAISTATPVCSVAITMVDIGFQPNVFTIPADQQVQIVLTNTGFLPHDFTLEELHIDVDVDSMTTKSIVVSVPAGDYYFFCEQPGHEAAGMVGTMHVASQ